MSGFWQDKRVFITGATGLVGSWLTRELVNQGAYVVVLIRDQDPQSELYRSGTIQRVSIVNGRLEEYRDLERAINEHEIDTVFHLGAQTIVGTAYRSPLPTFEANIRGTYNLLEACRVHSGLVKRVLVASSDKAYGDSAVLPYTEEMPPMGQHPYDVSKSCTDLLSQTYHHTYGTPVVVARCGNIYGGGDLNWSRIIPGTIRSFLNGQAPVVRSDGTLTRDYVYVMDAVEAYLKMAQEAHRPEVQGQVFNFGPDQPRNVLQVIDALAQVMDRAHLKPVVLNQAKAEIQDQYLDSSKARAILNWEPTYSFEAGLQATVEWYRRFFEVQP
ncbi:GDP-mannose 4,6-dehydratase [Deinococcus cellulosilyticus]|uniref:Putative sugar dehydratase/epimerase YfnG n=1 Tax=Deinococcus cellulosilyticus (strain DSM 18568 / NBRC 106333 / KACC 11606 / 5516J-15) TaxID=1223518 RepID=A0A511MY25_DEIC1|nr:GDP-mannose 4,6-dehydratase [Deinococcus cellulosilyticus]GEM45261.1 putative sugar dehydratase/epimerase YfnG [Deinococcus cellulosilyticus NBRC 106333 = KACC 11606]